jgi:RHS repeat-associated protein
MTELNSAGAWVHTNVMANGSLIATFDNDNNGAHFYLTDWLGTRRVQTNYIGAVENTWTSLPYGDALASSNNLDPTEQHFTGKERDTESGNDYFGARYYASTMGRFISPDWSAQVEPVPYAKLDNPQTLNLYSYVRNNPLAGVDADGHCPGMGPGEGSSECSHTEEIETGEIEKGEEAYVKEWVQPAQAQPLTQKQIDARVQAQKVALAKKLSARTRGEHSAADIAKGLGYHKTKGGNADFTMSPGLVTDLNNYDSLDPLFSNDDSKGNVHGCLFSCRVGIFSSPHTHEDDIHMDRANGSWMFPLGFILHLGGDIIPGWINGSTPF